MLRTHGRPLALVGAVGSAALGVAVAVYNMFDWTSHEHFFAQAALSGSFVSYFYLAESISIFLLLLGLYLAYNMLRRPMRTPGSISLIGIIASAVSDKQLRRTAVVTTALYGILYGFASSILVFQPGVDFAAAYGATGVASTGFVPCCGGAGTLPKLIVYLSPAHFALQLVPLSLILLFIVPPLVGLNVSIALFSMRRAVARLTGRWMVACGAAVGLFTACPTCAGLFLAESVGGVGATTLAVALAPYQLLFVAISLPVLLASPFFFAMRVRSARPATSAVLAGEAEGAGDRPLSAGNR